MTLRLIDLESPLDDVAFPNGTTHVPVPFGANEYKLWRGIQETTDALERGTALIKIVTACYPTATADDLDSCTPKMLIAMAAHAGRKIDQVMDALKNADAGVEAPQAPTPAPEQTTTPPLSPKTNGDTSSPRSRKRSARIGTTSTSAALTGNPI